jgi:nucleoside diphosphate kinase
MTAGDPGEGSLLLGGDETRAAAVPEGLSAMAAKRWYYARETYFREAWREAEARWAGAAIDVLRRHTFILFKPDAVAARRIGRTLACLDDMGFVPVHQAPIRFDRLSLRELWRYELNLATFQRLDAIDLLLPATRSLLVFLRDGAAPSAGESAADRLRRLKGPSLVHLREPGHLRARIGAGTGLLNLIHTPDEPADVVREMGVLLDEPARREAFTAMDRSAEGPIPLHAMEASLYAEVPAHDLDLGGCVERIERACARVPDGHAARAVREGCRLARETGRCDFRAVLAAASAAGVEIAAFDRVVFAAACTEPSLPGVKPLLKA